MLDVFKASPIQSCNDCRIVCSNSACADAELVGGGGGWNSMLFYHFT